MTWSKKILPDEALSDDTLVKVIRQQHHKEAAEEDQRFSEQHRSALQQLADN